jgi:hypothetical protein
MKEKLLQNKEALASLLSRKIEAFEDYYTATVLLDQTLAEKDIMKIEALVKLRESQIGNITLIDREIQKLSAGNSPYARSVNKNVSDLAVKLEEVIRRTRDNDNSCIGSATALLKEISNDLMFIDRGLHAFQGYNKKQSRKSRFLDIKT